MKRRRKKHCGNCAAACIIIAVGVVWLCFLSYRFIFIAIAVFLVLLGIILVKKNC